MSFLFIKAMGYSFVFVQSNVGVGEMMALFASQQCEDRKVYGSGKDQFTKA